MIAPRLDLRPHTPDAPSWWVRSLTRPVTYVTISLGILLLDLLSGPHLLFPILFVLPVAMAAWFYRASWAYSLAILLPIGRFFIAELVDLPSPLVYIIVNAIIRIVVLLILAFFVSRTALQSKQLKERLAGFVTMCAWSRTVEFEGEWISFEEYLKRRFDLDTSHGIAPGELQRAIGHLKNPESNETETKEEN